MTMIDIDLPTKASIFSPENATTIDENLADIDESLATDLFSEVKELLHKGNDFTRVFSLNGGSSSAASDLVDIIKEVPRSLSRERFIVRQKWEGYVLDVRKDTFLASLSSITGDDESLEAEIYLEEINEEDLDLLRPGAVFYWSIGYLVKPTVRYAADFIRFRRLVWTQQDFEKAKSQSLNFSDLFDEE